MFPLSSLYWSVAGFGVATIVFGFSTNFWLSMAALALTGAFDNVSMVIRQVITQMSTPNEMRGRVSAVSSIFIGSSGAIIEALERGCKVIQITEIPILDFYSKYFWSSIKSKKINENIFTYSLIKKGNLIKLGKKPKNLDFFFNSKIY